MGRGWDVLESAVLQQVHAPQLRRPENSHELMCARAEEGFSAAGKSVAIFIIIIEVRVRSVGGSGQDPGGLCPALGWPLALPPWALGYRGKQNAKKRGVGDPSVQRETPWALLLWEKVISASFLSVAMWGEPAGVAGGMGMKHQHQKEFVAFVVSCCFTCF